MKKHIRWSYHLWQLFWVSLVLLPISLGAWYVWQLHQRTQTAMDDVAPKHARLQGLIQVAPDIAQKQGELNTFMQGLSYPSTSASTEAANEAQQSIRQVFEEAGFTVVSMQVVTDREDSTSKDPLHEHIPITLRVEGPQPALATALQGIRRLRPVVMVNHADVQTQGPVRPEVVTKLSAQLQLTVLRART